MKDKINLNRRNAIRTLPALCAGLSVPYFLKTGCSVSTPRPNIIVFLSDDQVYQSVGSRDPFYQTPNINSLAEKGYLFDRSYVTTSICPVSRASIFTGQFAETHGQLGWHRAINRKSFDSIFPFELKKAGYQIGFLGKWGIANPAPTRMFDRFQVFEGQGVYFDETDKEYHLTRRLADQACRTIEAFQQSDQPYMLMISFKAPHGQKDLPFEKSSDTKLDYPEFDMSIHQEYPYTYQNYAKLPEFLQKSKGRKAFLSMIGKKEAYQRYLHTYAKLIFGVDHAVGEVLNAATTKEDINQLEVMYLSDNGMMLGQHGIFGKWLMYEDSVRIPYLWKPSLYSKHSKAVLSNFVLNIDLAPTLLRAAGVTPPSGYQGIALQDLGRAATRNDYYYSFYTTMNGTIPVCHGLQNKKFKYIHYIQHNYEQLFDMESDPDEVNNLAYQTEFTAIAKQMKTKMQAYRQQAGPYFEKA